MEYNHICSLDQEHVMVKQHRGWQRNLIQISHINLRSKKYFRSWASVQKERRRIKDLGLAYMIHPFSIFRMYWEPFVWIMLYISLFIIPINIAYGGCANVAVFYNTFSENWDKLELIFDLVHLSDVIMTFFTGYFIVDTREVIMKPRQIAKYYLKSFNFYLDIICCTPIQSTLYMYETMNGVEKMPIFQYIKLSTFIKIGRLPKILSYFQHTILNLNRHLRICLKYMLLSFLVLHWLTCLHILFRQFLLFNKGVNRMLLYPSNYINIYDVKTIYCMALYNVVGTILNIKLMEPCDSIELIYSTPPTMIFFMSYALLGFTVSKILMVLLLQIVKSLTSSEIKYYAIKSQLYKYMEYKMLPKVMSNRIISYYEYRFQRKYFRESTILDMLSENLRRDINLYCCRTLIESVTLLKNLPADIISDVVSNLKYEVFLYNDLIVKAGTTGDCMYFIANGTVAVSTPTGKEICHLQDGAYFGEIALISKEQKRVANVVAIEICEIYRLDRRNFRSCFPLNSVFYKRIEQIAQERMQKTMLLEELHKKYIMERTTKRKADYSSSH